MFGKFIKNILFGNTVQEYIQIKIRIRRIVKKRKCLRDILHQLHNYKMSCASKITLKNFP